VAEPSGWAVSTGEEQCGPITSDGRPTLRADRRTSSAERLDLLLPRTDSAVLVEFIVVVVVLGIALALVWRRPDWRFLVASSGLLVLSLMALRAMH